MARLLHLSKVKVEKEVGHNKIKRAQFEGFPEVVRMGVHGGIAEFFKLQPDEPLPSTLDYIVAAIGGCMAGTVSGALEARGISAAPDKFQVEAEGKIEEVEGKMILTHVSLRYRLQVPAGKRVSVEKALAHHESFCAVSESIRRGIVVEWKSEIEEESESDSQQKSASSSAAQGHSVAR
jgi:uncharacterized OsmC-like protein